MRAILVSLVLASGVANAAECPSFDFGRYVCTDLADGQEIPMRISKVEVMGKPALRVELPGQEGTDPAICESGEDTTQVCTKEERAANPARAKLCLKELGDYSMVTRAKSKVTSNALSGEIHQTLKPLSGRGRDVSVFTMRVNVQKMGPGRINISNDIIERGTLIRIRLECKQKNVTSV